MTITTERTNLKSMQAIIDNFNYALAFLDTTTEEIRLQAIVRRAFREEVSLACKRTNDIALKHQYQLLLGGQSTANPLAMSVRANIQPAAESEIFAIYNGRQCFGGAEIAQDLDAVKSASLTKYNVTLADAGITERALCVQNVVLSEIYNNQASMALLEQLVEAADSEGFPALCITGNTNGLRQLQKAAKVLIALKTLKRATLFAIDDEFGDQSVLHISVQAVH